MSEVILELGPPTHFSAAAWVQWDERTNGLGDLSVFSGLPVGPRVLVRIRVFRAVGRVQFQVVDVPDGRAGWSSSEELSAAWEMYAQAIVLRSTGLGFDLDFTGPDNALSPDRDSTEAYAWRQANSTSQEAWFDAFEAAGRPATTAIISDGIPDRDAGLSARAGSPTASIGAERVGITDRDAGLSARAGSPTAAIGAERVGITDRDAGLSARAGSPTAAIGAERVGITDRDAGLSARAGSPTAAIGAERVGITDRDAGLSARAGSPTAAIGAERVGITDRDAGLSARAGSPTASIGVTAQRGIVSLLPPNASPLERALEAAIAPRVTSEVIRQVWDPATCPAKLLPWLAWAMSVDYWEDEWAEDQKRGVIAASIQVHRRKGTVSAMRRVVEGLGYGFELVEWWELVPEGTPGTAEVYLFRQSAGRPIANEDLILTRRLLEDAKRGTLHLTVTPSYQARSQVYLYARADAHKIQSFSYAASRVQFAGASATQLYLYARADAFVHQEFSYPAGF